MRYRILMCHSSAVQSLNCSAKEKKRICRVWVHKLVREKEQILKQGEREPWVLLQVQESATAQWQEWPKAFENRNIWNSVVFAVSWPQNFHMISYITMSCQDDGQWKIWVDTQEEDTCKSRQSVDICIVEKTSRNREAESNGLGLEHRILDESSSLVRMGVGSHLGLRVKFIPLSLQLIKDGVTWLHAGYTSSLSCYLSNSWKRCSCYAGQQDLKLRADRRRVIQVWVRLENLGRMIQKAHQIWRPYRR